MSIAPGAAFVSDALEDRIPPFSRYARLSRLRVAKYMRRATPKDVQGNGPDAIHIEQLELFARVGVTETERASTQRLTVSITLWPKTGFENLQEDIGNTIDYSAVCAATREFVEKRADKLIETLATELARHLLKSFPLRKVEIDLRKFVLPNAQFASVSVTRANP